MYRFMEVEEKGGGKKLFLHCKQKETRLDWSSDVLTDKS